MTNSRRTDARPLRIPVRRPLLRRRRSPCGHRRGRLDWPRARLAEAAMTADYDIWPADADRHR